MHFARKRPSLQVRHERQDSAEDGTSRKFKSCMKKIKEVEATEASQTRDILCCDMHRWRLHITQLGEASQAGEAHGGQGRTEVQAGEGNNVCQSHESVLRRLRAGIQAQDLQTGRTADHLRHLIRHEWHFQLFQMIAVLQPFESCAKTMRLGVKGIERQAAVR